ncbi:putative fungal specific transcription factor [Fonsecaea pedrosoi]|nr:putative fungal specific transcription factor [Fonsecaea pedrosoi]
MSTEPLPLSSPAPRPQRNDNVRPKRVVACNYCRAKKIRLERLEQLEALLKQQAYAPTSTTNHIPAQTSPAALNSDSSRFTGRDDRDPLSSVLPAPSSSSLTTDGVETQSSSCFPLAQPYKTHNPPASLNSIALIPPKPPAFADNNTSTLEWSSGYQPTPSDSAAPATLAENSPEQIRERSSISSSETSNWEYHGPRSFLSICSRPGMQWVASKTGSSIFDDTARTFTTYITRRLKIEKNLSKERKPEPDQEIAWRYTRAFFDEALESSLGIVHRPWFEAQLRAYFDGAVTDTDPTWYALRNAVYASGCRIELSKTSTFQEANQSAWGYFENALSVQTEMLYFRTSIVGVQALTLMAYFTQNIACPCLEYVLCGIAVRLGIAKGLHRQAVASWNLTEYENSLRSCLFWAIYCLEKQIVCQSGRHSVGLTLSKGCQSGTVMLTLSELIDDDDVSCQVPTSAPPDSSVNIEYCNTLIRLARLSSVVSKRLSTVQAFQQGGAALVRSVTELDEQLNMLKRTIDPVICRPSSPSPSHLPPGMTMQQVMYLRGALQSITLDIHTALTYPWSRSICGMTPDAALRDQLETSTQIVAETCRQAILATEHIRFDASTPVPLSFFGPMYALINLFIYILQNPNRYGIQSDLALMEVGAGYFARVKFATASEISISFAREIATLAREATERAHRLHPSSTVSGGYDQDLTYLPQKLSENEAVPGQYLAIEDQPLNDQTMDDMGTLFDLELENWSTFLSTDFQGAVAGSSIGPRY